METIRLFIAAKITKKEVQDNLISFQSKFRFKGVKLVKDSHFHFTLHFLGATPLYKVPLLKNALETIQEPKFTLKLEHCGSFPNKKSPRVIWIGVSSGKDNLVRIQQSLIDPIKELEFKIDYREYSPHLTIARVKFTDKDTRSMINELLVENSDISIGECLIDKIYLIQSQLTPQGAIYTEIFSKELI
jgi:2'-5' RNA ligase